MRARLGQNFLKDRAVLQRIMDVAKVEKGELIVEIGPGKGVLTEQLLKREANVIAVEKDPALVEVIKNKLARNSGLRIEHTDIRVFDFENDRDIQGRAFRIIANIPYYLTSYLLRQIFALEHPPEQMILLMQKEVAQRIVAKEGDMNLLALMVQFFADPELLFTVPRGAFNPPPKVESAVIIFKNIESKYKEINFEDFFVYVKKAFSSKRKMLANTLANEPSSKERIYDILQSLDISIQARPQHISLDQWVKIYKKIKKNNAQ